MRTSILDWGLLLHTRDLIRGEGTASFDELWDQAARAEEAGFDHIWLGDSVTILSKARGDSIATMSALAVKTSRIRIGSVPFLAALRNPVLLAHALATADVISQGRILVGVAVGPMHEYIERQFDACGVPFHEKAGRLSETIDLLRRLWTEKSFAYEGKYFHFEEIGLLPKPVQKPTIPIWIVADRSENAFKRVARLGDGWVTLSSSLEKFECGRKKIDAYAGRYSRSGKIPVSALYASFNLNRDGEKARSEGWAWMEKFFAQPRSKLAHHFAVFGTPDECAGLLGGYVKAGLTTLIVRIASNDWDRQTKFLLEELKPRLEADSTHSIQP